MTRKVLVACAVVAATIVPTPAAADVGAVQRQLDLLTTVDRMPGALAQVRDRHNRTVTLTSGTAELGTGRPMVGAEGRFRVASVTKSFVATAVLQLVVAGKVRLDEPIDTYLPGVVHGSGEGAEIDGREITVRQLLRHTSGIPDYAAYMDLSDFTPPPIAPEELLGLALEHKPYFPPGAGWRYSNTGYVIAGMLIERLTGQDVSEVVTERVIKRAGLRDTYWPRAGEHGIRGPHALNYRENPAGQLIDATPLEPTLAGAAGALISTPTDINRFWRALFGGRLLPHWAVAEMRDTVPAPEFGAGVRYGLGLIRLPLPCGGYAWGHGGDALGVANESASDDRGATATVYRTAQTESEQPGLRTLRTLEIALCTSRR